MNTKLKADLEAHIAAWMDANCDCANWPKEWVYDDLAKDMAAAASFVFDAGVKAQQFANTQDA